MDREVAQQGELFPANFAPMPLLFRMQHAMNAGTDGR